jgi:hypothetical protein
MVSSEPPQMPHHETSAQVMLASRRYPVPSLGAGGLGRRRASSLLHLEVRRQASW